MRRKESLLVLLVLLSSFVFAQEQCPCGAFGSNTASAQVDPIAMAAFNHTSIPSTANNTSAFDVASTTTDTTHAVMTNIASGFQIKPVSDASLKSYYHQFTETLIPSTSTNNIGTVIGHATQIDDWGAGNASNVFPLSSIFNKHGNTNTDFTVALNGAVNNFSQTGTIGTAIGTDSWVTTGQYVANHIGTAYAGRFFVDTQGGSPGGLQIPGAGASIATAYGIYNQIQNNPSSSIGTAYGFYTVLNNGAESPTTVGNFYGFYVDTPLLVNGGNEGAAHSYALYINDQTVHNGLNNPDPWAIKIIGGNSDLGPGITTIGTLAIANPGSAAASKAVCFKTDGKTLGYCSTAIDSSGNCTCN